MARKKSQDTYIKEIEKIFAQLVELCDKAELTGWTKRFEVGAISEDLGYFCSFDVEEFKEKCLMCGRHKPL